MLIQTDEHSGHLAWFAAWYRAQCNGIWEHTLGMRLRPYERTLRPPSALKQSQSEGWQLTIELAGTSLAPCQPRTLLLDSMDGGWLSCSLTRDRFVGCGDTEKVEEILGVFRRWIEPVRTAVEPPQIAIAGSRR